MRRASLMAFTGTLLSAAMCAASAEAQSSSMFGNRGVQNSGNSLSNGVGGGNRGNTQSSFGNTGTLTGFSGQTTGSQAGFASGINPGSGLAGMSNSGTFVGNRNSMNAATGANGQAGGTANRSGGLSSGRGGAGGLSSMGGRNSNAQRNRGNVNRGASTAGSVAVRPAQRIAFDYSPRTEAQIEASLGTQVAGIVATQGGIRGVSAQADGRGTVTLNGSVSSEADRRKAEVLTRLEPGVRNVVNQITVAEQP